MKKVVLVFLVAFVFLAGCGGDGPDGGGESQIQSSGVSCVFLERCPGGRFVDGKCDYPPECRNGVCEQGEDASSCPADCASLEECSGGGRTGESVAPRNLFRWSFDDIGISTCDWDDPDHYNCDALQALISIMQKLQRLEDHLQNNGLPQATINVPGVGEVYKLGENSIKVRFGKLALLSDNLASTQLQEDFAQRERKGTFFGSPSWLAPWLNYFPPDNPADKGISIEYVQFPNHYILEENLHEEGVYFALAEIEFATSNGYFFDPISGAPNANIKMQLNPQGINLPDYAVLDLALNGDLGVENPDRDYGIKWSPSATPVVFSRGGPFGSTPLESSIYLYGANPIASSDPIRSSVVKAPAFYTPKIISGAAEEKFFGNKPVLLETIATDGRAVFENLTDSPVVEGQEYFAVSNPTSVMPLAAIVERSTTLVLGSSGLPNAFALPEPWVKFSELGQSCADFQWVSELPPVTSICGDAALVIDESGQLQVNQTPANLPEILENYPRGLIIPNYSNMHRLYLNLAYVPTPLEEYEPSLKLCNNAGEISSTYTTASSINNIVPLFNQAIKAETIEDIIEGVKRKEVCVYKQTFSGEEQRERYTQCSLRNLPSSCYRFYGKDIVATTDYTKTTYLWNTDKILNEIYPRLLHYERVPELGTIQFCT